MKIALLQLVSEQTMQNLVAILAFKPAKVIHFTTGRTASRSARILDAAKLAGICPEHENIMLSGMPSIAETTRALVKGIERAKEAGYTPVINFTGGTKMMSIGAYQAAREKECSSFYVDGDREEFIDGFSAGDGLASLLASDMSFTAFRDGLTVNAIAAANGREFVSKGRDWAPYQRLANFLLKNEHEENEAWGAVHGPEGLCPYGREPRKPREWLELLERPLGLSCRVGEMAAEVGIVECKGKGWYLPSGCLPEMRELASQERMDRRQWFQAILPLQQTLAFLSGGWWEVSVMEAACRSGQFHDLRWSVDVGTKAGELTVEEDIVGVTGLQVAYFSCKRGGAKSRLVSVLDELDHRARSIGGSFTKRFLCVLMPLYGADLRNVQRRAAELNGIRIITPDDLETL